MNHSITRKEIYKRIFQTMFYRIWLYRKRHYIITLLQLVMPPLILYILVTTHAALFSTKDLKANYTEYELYSVQKLFKSVCDPNCGVKQTLISYVTPEEFPEQFERTLEQSAFSPWYSTSDFRFLKLRNEDEMLQLAVLHHIQDQNYVAGIVFTNSLDKSTFPVKEMGHSGSNLTIPSNISYNYELAFKIRMVRYIPSELSSFGSFNLDDSNVKYYLPFMGLQLAVTRAFLNYSHNGTFKEPYQIFVQGFPTPPHTEYQLITHSNTFQFVSTSLVLGLTFVVYSLIRAPCSDQETKFKPYLHMMGFPRWSYWLCWILNDGVIQVSAVGLQVALLFLNINDDLGIVVKHGNPAIWSIFLVLYAMAAISFCTFLASFFKRGILATYVAATIWLLSFYFSDLFLPSYILSISLVGKLAMCLVPNAALIWGVTLMSSNAGGINYDNLYHRLEKNGISLFEIMIVLGVDIIVYYSLAFFNDRVHQGFLARKSWLSVFKPPKFITRHLCFKSKNTLKHAANKRVTFNNQGGDAIASALEDSTSYFSSGFDEKEAIVCLEHLTKIYHNKTKAINDVSIRIQAGKITAFVGHYASGKSSLINLLCGECSPTEGTIRICGYDIEDHKARIQSLISVCMSENVFCYDMTVLQHCLFIAKLKGMNHRKAKEQAKNYIGFLELSKKMNKFPEDLFEHEKKKLSIIMAFMGNSKIVILDEPTKGLSELDMIKEIWDFILTFRGHKTVIITTVNVQEGCHLGDRIAILSNGKLVASGSRQHLDKLFATGYHLHMKLAPDSDQHKVRGVIHHHITTMAALEPSTVRILRASSLVDQDIDLHTKHHYTEEMSVRSNMFYDAESTFSDFEDVESVIENLHRLPKPKQSKASTSQRNDEDVSGQQEIEVMLPKFESPQFAELFELLENKNVLQLLGIKTWRLSSYRIERAFREANEYVQLSNEDTLSILAPKEIETMQTLLEQNYPRRLGRISCALQRFKGLLIKRLMWILGMKIHVLVQILVPIMLILITIQGTNPLFHAHLDKFEQDISISNYANPTVLMKNNKEDTTVLELYRQSVRLQSRYAKIKELSTDFLTEIKMIDYDPLAVLSGQFIAGVNITNTTLTTMFSPIAFHSGPIALNLVLNAYMSLVFPNDSIGISVSSHPIESQPRQALKFYVQYDALNDGDDEVLTFAVMLGFGFFILSAGFTAQPVAERVWNIKHLQLNTSVSKFLYWFAFLLVDCLVAALVPVIMIVIMWKVPDHHAFSDHEFIKTFLGFYVLASFSSIILSYNASFILRRPNTSFFAMLSISQFFGIFVFVLAITINVSPTINTVFRFTLAFVLQPYTVIAGFYSIITAAIRNNRCDLLSNTVKHAVCSDVLPTFYNLTINTKNETVFDRSCCLCESEHCPTNINLRKLYFRFDTFHSEQLSVIFALLLFHSIVLMILLWLMQIGIVDNYIKRLIYKKSDTNAINTQITKSNDEHESVELERQRVHEALHQEKSVREKYFIIHLTSPVNINSYPVLSSMQFFCKPGEITKIFGPVGCGKTILLLLLNKIKDCKNGRIYFNDRELFFGSAKDTKLFLSNIGYCPKNIDKLYTKLTGHQLLKLFGRLRGIPENELNTHVNKWLTIFSLTKRANEDYRFYSESMKRRLFITLSLIGEPQVLLLDNPTLNLDPVSKYQFWTVMNHLATKENRTILITTDRVEDLQETSCCHKLVVLVNGKIQVVMNPQELMDSFGKGYTVIITLKSRPAEAKFSDYANLKTTVETELHGSQLQEEQQDSLRFTVPSRKELKWSDMFRILEQIKYDFQKILAEYEVRETQLEDICYVMALKQIPNRVNTISTTLDKFCTEYC